MSRSAGNYDVFEVGIDEAGRGALAGPVVAAAVILDPKKPTSGLDDSKKLTASRRVEMAAMIRTNALAWSVAFIDSERIDEVNILQATYDAMHAAVDELSNSGEYNSLKLLVDGNRFRPHRFPHETIVGGDALIPSISAASILAKTERDRYMREVAHGLYPRYNFAQHKGYGTQQHRSALVEHGPCPIHRKLFIRKVFASAVYPPNQGEG